jgi:hypothetical protein
MKIQLHKTMQNILVVKNHYLPDSNEHGTSLSKHTKG